MPRGQDRPQVSVSLDAQDKAALEQAAQARSWSVSALVGRIVTGWLLSPDAQQVRLLRQAMLSEVEVRE